MPCYAPLRAVLVSSSKGRRISFSSSSVGKGLSLPCGRCIGCRLERARQWAVRILHESKMHDSCSFLTLTYERLPGPCAKCAPQVEGSVCVCECQLFLKRLRAHLAPKRIRFFLCGEYGEKLGRPHYHMILFGHDFPDKVKLKVSSRSEYCLYESETLNRLWGLGSARIGSVSFDSAVYVANYATKKINGEGAKMHYQGRRPEFLLMSRRPGIAASWLERFSSDVFPSDEVVVNGVQARPPRYYDKLLEMRSPDMLAALKVRREAEADKLENMVLKSGVSVFVAPSRNARRLAVREVVARAKLAIKSRVMEK